MADPSLIKDIKYSVLILVISNARVGHFIEAHFLKSSGFDYIGKKNEFYPLQIKVISSTNISLGFHFFYVLRDFGEVFRSIREGATLIRTQGDIILEKLWLIVIVLNNLDDGEVFMFPRKSEAPYVLVAQTM
ncbi:Pyridoxal 5'-phosphate synthase-like subunit PDX1.2 [Bienertia sinuspersici]